MSASSHIPSAPPLSTFNRWPEERLKTSREAALRDWRGDQDVWVFGYGSLIWKPEFDFIEQRSALLPGHHRALCLWSRINRGTPELPGLVFGLEAGGECHGMAFRVAAELVLPIFETLWRREMATGAYHPSWIDCQTPQGAVKALAFVIDRAGPAYVPEPSDDALIEIILRASGIYGSCLEYVTQTADALEAVGIHDARLSALVTRLKDRLNQQQHSLS
jgi:glutathione-specific gamma-glutamylcyclotransferase